jgi:hypothetical protein
MHRTYLGHAAHSIKALFQGLAKRPCSAVFSRMASMRLKNTTKNVAMFAKFLIPQDNEFR